MNYEIESITVNGYSNDKHNFKRLEDALLFA